MSWLFVDKDNDVFENSKLIQFLSKISNEKLAIIFLALSFVCLWYESFFSSVGIRFVEGFNFAIIFLFLSFIFCDKKRLKLTKAMTFLLLFVMVLLISGLWAGICGLAIAMIISGIFLFCQFVLAFVISSTFRAKNTVINLLLLISIPLLLVGCYQGLSGQTTSRLWVSTAENLVQARAFGFFGSPNILGGLAMITVIIAVSKFLSLKKWWYLVYGIIALLALVLTFSRSAWIGLGVGIAAALLIKNWKLIFISPLVLLALIVPSIKQRIFVSLSQSYMIDAALDGRVWSFNTAMEIFKTSPIIGTGPGTYGGQTAIYFNSPVYLRGIQNGYVALPYTDNQWLQIAVQTGILGLITIVGFFISHLVNNLKRYFKTHEYLYLGVVAATIALLINGLFANVLEFGAVSILGGVYLGLGNYHE